MFFVFIIQTVYKEDGRVFDSRSRGCGFEPHRRHCVVSLNKTLYPLLNRYNQEPHLTQLVRCGT